MTTGVETVTPLHHTISDYLYKDPFKERLLFFQVAEGLSRVHVYPTLQRRTSSQLPL